MRRILEEHPDAVSRGLLEAGRDIEAPEQSKSRLLAAIAAGGTLVASSTTGVGATATTGGAAATSGKVAVAAKASLGGFPLALKLGVGAIVLASSALLIWQVSATPPKVDPAPAAQSQAAPKPTGVPHAALPEAPEPKADPVTAPAPKPRAAARASARAVAVAPVAADELRREAQWVERLRSAVKNGQGARAHEMVDGYRREFPAGQLGPEVDVLERRLHDTERGE
jgi:hypothetical protein